MNRAAATLCLSMLLAAAAYAGAQESMLKETTESKYKVGVYTITVAEAVGVMEETLNQ